MIGALRFFGVITLPALWAMVGVTTPLSAQDVAADPNAGCYTCHADSDEVMAFEDGVERAIKVDKRAFLESSHGKLACIDCHVGLDPMEHAFEERGPYGEYRTRLTSRCAECHSGAEGVDAALRPSRTIDGHLHSTEAEGSPSCVDCHAPHAVPRGQPQLLAAASASCADCHAETYATFAASIHGGSLTTPGNVDLPACADCHMGHEETGRTLAERNVRLGRPCMGCHSDKERMERYGLSTSVVSTYLNDFHGVSVRFYGEEEKGAGMPTLVCADCHGIHDVAAMTPVASARMKSQLVNVCRSCHTDASETFPDAWLSHYEPSLSKAPLVFAVKLGYWIFIPFVIIGLSLQIFAHLVLLPRRKRREKDASPAPAHVKPGDAQRFVTRFNRRQRVEHFLVMSAFILLLLTGLPQKFWDHGWAIFVASMFGGIDMMRAVHRVTGIVFTALCVVHVLSAIGAILAGRTGMTIVPHKKDFRDAVVNLKYYAGLTDEQTEFDRFDYRQKFEYWGMIVGSVVMIVSGFILYFPMQFAEALPGQLIPAAKMAHTYEAMMALLTIIIWHMYGAHLNPDCFPMDRSIFTGKISVARMKHEHGLEWEREKDRLTPVIDEQLRTRPEGADRGEERVTDPGLPTA